MAPGELAAAIPGRGRAGLDRLVSAVPRDVGGEGAGGLVAAAAVFLQGLHRDPVQLATQQVIQLARVGLAVGRDGGLRLGRARSSRVLGGGGSCSRMIRRTSSRAALRKVAWSNGVVPVKSS